MSEPFWQKNSLATHIFFDLCLFKPFCPVANFEQQSIGQIIGGDAQNFVAFSEYMNFTVAEGS